jgi:hypothetical protein
VSDPDLAFFVDLECQVWEALRRGDPDADRGMLAPHFLGVYPDGFGDRADHAGQLGDGPTVEAYDIDEARHLTIADGHVMLAYRASFRRPGAVQTERMYVSSLWSHVDGRWVNVFSQDTPIGGPGSVV